MAAPLKPDTPALPPPAPFWRVTVALCLVILAGVGLSFIVFFYSYNQINVAVARQVERPVIKAVAQIQSHINTAYDMLRSLQQAMRLSPDVSAAQLGDFAAAVNQPQVPYAGVYLVRPQKGQNDQQISLNPNNSFALPPRLLDEPNDIGRLIRQAQGQDGIISGVWKRDADHHLVLVERCSTAESQCFILALLALPNVLQSLEALVMEKALSGYALYQQRLDRDDERMPTLLHTRRTTSVGWSVFDNQINGDHIVLRDSVWAVRYYAQPDQGSQLLLFLPYLLMGFGLLMTGFAAIYVINNHEYQKEVFTLTGSLQTSNEQLESRIATEAAMAQALRDSERKFRAIFENAGIGICQVALDRKWLAANPRLAQILGYADAAELLREQPDQQDRLFVDAAARQSFLAGLDKRGQSDVELAVRRKDGVMLWVTMRGHVVRDAEDAPLYYECTLQDVTQRRQSERALLSAKEQADLANRSKSEFLANMSHELRTPLNAIIGFSEIIKDQLLGPEGTPQYIEYAKDIHDSGELLLSLINDILDMSKIEAGKRALSETAINVESVVQSCMRLVAVRAKAGGLQLKHDIPVGLLPLRGEERAIKQVLVNLMTNAIKFTPEGGTVGVKAHIDPFGRMCIAVSDTGIGIAPEDVPVALAPFGQIESVMSRKTQGTGLGLPLTKALVELHGGELQIKSAVGQGTTVSLLFPADRVVMRSA